MTYFRINKKTKETEAILKTPKYPKKVFKAKSYCGKDDVYNEAIGKEIAEIRAKKQVEYQKINDLKREINAFKALKQSHIDKYKRRIAMFNAQLARYKG